MESVIDANENTHNQAWFYVFIRFLRELETLDIVLERIANKKGKLPKQIGIMIEVPSDAILARKLAKKLLDIKDKYANYGVELTFFSFGTNDYSHLAAKGDREDPRMKLSILDPAAIKAIAQMKQEGYFYNDATKQLPLVDEGAEVMIQLMEAVVREANELDVETSLCGEAVTSLVGRGDYESAGKIMGMLKSFGVSMMSVRLAASMTRYDTMAATKEIVKPEQEREVLFDLSTNGKINQKKGVIKGEIVYVNSAQDLVADALKGLGGAALETRREFLKLQSPDSARSTMRIYNKIVVICRNLVAMAEEEFLNTMRISEFNAFVDEGLIKPIGNGLYVWTNLESTADKFSTELKQKGYGEEIQAGILAAWNKAYSNTTTGLERQGIDWDDLQYAKAIIVDSALNLEGWDVFRRDKGIIPTRIKAQAQGIGRLRTELEGRLVTLDYAAGKIYRGNLEVLKKEFTPRRLPIPQNEPQVEAQEALMEDANDVYKATIIYHPLVLLSYEKGTLAELEKIFDEYIGKLIDEADKIAKEANHTKKQWLIKGFQRKVEEEPEPIIRKALMDICRDLENRVNISLPENWIRNLREEYFTALKQGIEELIGSKSANRFIKNAFKQNMQEAIKQNNGLFVVHTTTSLNCVVFRNMLGGFLVEQVNPNPDYGLLGAARAIGDFWEVNRLELEAFKEVRASMPAEERSNFGLQITELKGTQSGAIMIAWKYILEDMGIIPGEEGLEIGVNITTPTDTLAVDRYFEYFDNFGTGLSFVTYKRMKLGAAWAGVDIYWNEWRRLARKEELEEIGDIAIKIVKGKLEHINGAAGEAEAKKKVILLQTNINMEIRGLLINAARCWSLPIKVSDINKLNKIIDSLSQRDINSLVDVARERFQEESNPLILMGVPATVMLLYLKSLPQEYKITAERLFRITGFEHKEIEAVIDAIIEAYPGQIVLRTSESGTYITAFPKVGAASPSEFKEKTYVELQGKQIEVGQEDKPYQIFGMSIRKWAREHGLLQKSKQYIDYEVKDYNNFMDHMYNIPVREARAKIQAYIEVMGLKLPAGWNKMTYRPGRTSKVKLTGFEKLIRWYVNDQFLKLFGEIDLREASYQDLPIWPLTESGRLDIGLISWFNIPGERAPPAYFKAKKLSLCQVIDIDSSGQFHHLRPIIQFAVGYFLKFISLSEARVECYSMPAKEAYNVNLAYIVRSNGNKGSPAFKDKIKALFMSTAYGLDSKGLSKYNSKIPASIINEFLSEEAKELIKIHESQTSNIPFIGKLIGEIKGLAAQYKEFSRKDFYYRVRVKSVLNGLPQDKLNIVQKLASHYSVATGKDRDEKEFMGYFNKIPESILKDMTAAVISVEAVKKAVDLLDINDAVSLALKLKRITKGAKDSFEAKYPGMINAILEESFRLAQKELDANEAEWLS
ncbi:MAG: hypothetical protein KJ838_01035, partial [Candidatus Omnitrophica bacterium]|nr:hypothetical protein [Candidatus Omnitrophota bacterium]